MSNNPWSLQIIKVAFHHFCPRALTFEVKITTQPTKRIAVVARRRAISPSRLNVVLASEEEEIQDTAEEKSLIRILPGY